MRHGLLPYLTDNVMIRKIFAAVLLLTEISALAAEPYYSFDFDASSETPLAGWICRGSGKTPKKTSLWSDYFHDGGDAYQVLSFPGVADAAYSNSNTEQGGKVDEWLISPEITVPAGKEAVLLRYDEIAIGSIRPNEYDVYLSSGGIEPQDFSTLLHSGRLKGTTSTAVSGTVCVPITGYAGKNIRIAFVNRSNGTGLLGFTGITLEDYFMDVTSLMSEFISQEDDVRLQFDISATTPQECKGFTAKLLVDGESNREYTTDADLSDGFEGSIRFTPDLHISIGEKKEYLLEITLSDASLPAFTYAGSITCAEGFPGVCVMEEATGTWCPACVRGAVSLERYSAEFPGQFFGIAVHERDPMTVGTYNTALKDESRISSFPAGWFNRQVLDDPQKIEHVRDFISRRMPTSVAIDRVDLIEEDGKPRMKVLYSPQLCYDTESARLRAVAVITEDHCKGTTSEWGQQNGYSDSTEESVGGPDWWPYFESFSDKNSYIPPHDMEFNHVAWGIFNDYAGLESDISTSWKAYTPQQYYISFDIPLQEEPNGPGVQNIENTSVTVILIDGVTGHVAGADRMEAARYNGKDPSGLKCSDASADFNVSRKGDMIYIAGDEDVEVQVFGLDGVRLAKCTLDNGSGAIHVHGCKANPLIVHVISGNATGIYKLR